jgi:rhamnosyltransferase
MNEKSSNAIALFAMHGELDDSRLQYIKYLEELPIQSVIVITTNMEHLERSKFHNFSKKVTFAYKENSGGLDFSLWHSQLDQVRGSRCLILANDSCTCTRSLLDVWKSMQSYDFWGITDSYEISHHLQSYFLVFQTEEIISKVYEYLKPISFKERHQVIRDGEIGLSTHLKKLGYKLSAAYEFKMVQSKARSNEINPSHSLWKTLEALRCPIIKRVHS